MQDIEKELSKIIKSRTSTNISDIQSEIEANHEYIETIQLRKLIHLHDVILQEDCIIPLTKLYERHNGIMLHNGDLQKWAELVDKNLRVLENTFQIIEENRSHT